MDRWSFHAFDLKAGTLLGELALSSWTHEDILSSSGLFTGVVAWRNPLLDQAAVDSTIQGRSVIVPMRDGSPLGYGGIIWRRSLPEVAGGAMLSYFDRQPFLPEGTAGVFTAVDQHSVMRSLVNWVQQNRGNIRIDTSQIGSSGVARTQTWNKWDAKNVGEALREKADNLSGFDFDFPVELDESGAAVRRMRMWTPRRGRGFTAGSSPQFTYGVNVIEMPSVPADGLTMVTEVVGKGVEINPTTKERQVAVSIRTDLLNLGWPRLPVVLDLPDVGLASAPSDLTALQAAVDGHAALHGAVSVDVIELKVDPDHTAARWGSWELGDDCMVSIPPGCDPAWPIGYSGVRRIGATKWTVSPTGEELRVVTLRPL